MMNNEQTTDSKKTKIIRHGRPRNTSTKGLLDPIRKTSINFQSSVIDMARQTMLARALKYDIKPENFTSYLIRLIREDYIKNKEVLMNLFDDKTSGYKNLQEKIKQIEGDLCKE